MRYAKFWAAALGAAVTILTTAFSSQPWEAPAVAALTALAVWLTPNKPAGPA